MTKERLEILLYNAIDLLEFLGHDRDFIISEIGMANEEYDVVMEITER